MPKVVKPKTHQKQPYLALKDDVAMVVSPAIVKEIVSYLVLRPSKFWGMKKPRHFFEAMLLATLHHDATLMGFQRFLKRYDLDFKISDKSLIHNIRCIRARLAEWAEEVIIPGSFHDWNMAASGVEIPPELVGTNLWMDSSDFPLQKRRGMNGSSGYWSHKLAGPGLRFMVLCDGNLIVRGFWGGYSPKFFDGHAALLLKSFFKQHGVGGVIVADQHFDFASKSITAVKFYVPSKAPPTRKQRRKACNKGKPIHNDPLKGRFQLAKKREEYNDKLAHHCARIEHVFAWLTKHFAALDQPFPEDEEQLNHVFAYAIAIQNKMRKLNFY